MAHPADTADPPLTGADSQSSAADRAPLSLQQEFLRMIDHGDDASPFGPRYHIVGGWRVTGPLDVDTLRAALDDVVARHETLRTSIVRTEDVAYQQIRPPASVDLLVRDLSQVEPGDRDRVAEDLVNEVEASPFEMDRQPQLGAVLGRFYEHDAVLVPVAHHTAADGWSMQLIMRDLAALYTARRTGRPADLPDPGQYRQFVAWQIDHAQGPEAQASREFWRHNLRGARVTPVATDKPRSAEAPPATAYHRFLLPDHFRSATQTLAVATRSSPFMVLLAAYALLLGRRAGVTDIVVPTFTPGRRQAWVLDTVGSFYNFVPLRIDTAGCATFRDVVAQAKQTCLAAYAHELPFSDIIAQAPDLMEEAIADTTTSCTFQVVQSPHIMADEPVGDIRYTAMRRRLLSQPVGSALPDGALWNLELNKPGIVGCIGYVSNLFDDRTMVDMLSDFCGLVTRVFADPDVCLDQI